jgi:hypothetical protein
MIKNYSLIYGNFEDVDVLREKTNMSDEILTVIVQGMQMGQVDHVRLAACNAMLNSLEFTRKNFECSVCSDFIPTLESITNFAW